MISQRKITRIKFSNVALKGANRRYSNMDELLFFNFFMSAWLWM